MVFENKVNSSAAQTIFEEMFTTGTDPHHIMKEKGLKQMDNDDELIAIIKTVLAGNQKAIDEYKSGKENAIQFLVGQVMAATKGKANPQKARELLLKQIR